MIFKVSIFYRDEKAKKVALTSRQTYSPIAITYVTKENNEKEKPHKDTAFCA